MSDLNKFESMLEDVYRKKVVPLEEEKAKLESRLKELKNSTAENAELSEAKKAVLERDLQSAIVSGKAAEIEKARIKLQSFLDSQQKISAEVVGLEKEIESLSVRIERATKETLSDVFPNYRKMVLQAAEALADVCEGCWAAIESYERRTGVPVPFGRHFGGLQILDYGPSRHVRRRLVRWIP